MIDAVYSMTKYTPEECMEFEKMHRKRSFGGGVADLVGGAVFFALALICTYVLFDGIVIDGRDYCSFITGLWNRLFVPFLPTTQTAFVKFLIGILYSLVVSLVLGFVIGKTAALFYGKKGGFVWDERGDSLEQYRMVYEKTRKDVVVGWSCVYLVLYILFFVVYTFFNPELSEINIFFAILAVAFVALVIAVVGFILGAVFSGALNSLIRGKKLRVFSRELEAYIKWKDEEKEERNKIEEQKRAEELYQQAISGDVVDEALMEKAYEAGNSNAIVYMAKRCVFECGANGDITDERKTLFFEKYGQLYKLDCAQTNEIVFLKCFCSAYAYDLRFNAIIDIKKKLVEIRKTGGLPAEYEAYQTRLEMYIEDLLQKQNVSVDSPEPPKEKDPWDDVPDGSDIDVSDM